MGGVGSGVKGRDLKLGVLGGDHRDGQDSAREEAEALEGETEGDHTRPPRGSQEGTDDRDSRYSSFMVTRDDGSGKKEDPEHCCEAIESETKDKCDNELVGEQTTISACDKVEAKSAQEISRIHVEEEYQDEHEDGKGFGFLPQFH